MLKCESPQHVFKQCKFSLFSAFAQDFLHICLVQLQNPIVTCKHTQKSDSVSLLPYKETYKTNTTSLKALNFASYCTVVMYRFHTELYCSYVPVSYFIKYLILQYTCIHKIYEPVPIIREKLTLTMVCTHWHLKTVHLRPGPNLQRRVELN